MKMRELHELLGRELNEEWHALRVTLGRIDEILLCATEGLVMRGTNGSTPLEMPFVCDMGHHQLQIFDKNIDFSLSYTDKSGVYSDDRVAMLLESLHSELGVLIQSCEKRPLSC